jgi:hypothetical protein
MPVLAAATSYHVYALSLWTGKQLHRFIQNSSINRLKCHVTSSRFDLNNAVAISLHVQPVLLSDLHAKMHPNRSVECKIAGVSVCSCRMNLPELVGLL